MPKESKSLYEQAVALRAKADELLKMKAATEIFSTLESIKYDLGHVESDLKRATKSIEVYKYDIEKLDKKHPDYARKLESLQNNLASMQVSEANYKRRADDLKISIDREDKHVKSQITKIEAGEILRPSSMEKSGMVKELLNKMTYGV